MSDLVERLREVAERADANYPAIMEQAAARIEQLEAALREIAKVTRGWEPGVWTEEEGRRYFAALFFGAQKVARAALEDKCTSS